jgi:hypothetical protein
MEGYLFSLFLYPYCVPEDYIFSNIMIRQLLRPHGHNIHTADPILVNQCMYTISLARPSTLSFTFDVEWYMSGELTCYIG